MNLQTWETTIQQIADESSLAPTESGQQRILSAWRAKLEKEPTSLQPFQIDEIVRQVRKRMTVASRRRTLRNESTTGLTVKYSRPQKRKAVRQSQHIRIVG